MGIQAAEISAILKEQIKNFGQEAEVAEVGRVLSVGDGIGTVIPWVIGGANTERIGAVTTHGVPVGAAEAEPFSHGFAGDHFVGLVVLECERVFGVGPFILDGLTGERTHR